MMRNRKPNHHPAQADYDYTQHNKGWLALMRLIYNDKARILRSIAPAVITPHIKYDLVTGGRGFVLRAAVVPEERAQAELAVLSRTSWLCGYQGIEVKTQVTFVCKLSE